MLTQSRLKVWYEFGQNNFFGLDVKVKSTKQYFVYHSYIKQFYENRFNGFFVKSLKVVLDFFAKIEFDFQHFSQ